MAEKKFTQKVGYQDSLEFDPINGIMKYGNYEAYASEMGVKPQSKKVTLDDYIKSVQKASQPSMMGMAASNMFGGQISEQQRKQYRPEFEAYMDSFFGGSKGRVMTREQPSGIATIDALSRNQSSPDVFGVGFSSTTGSTLLDISNSSNEAREAQNFSRVSAAKRLGADEYEIVTYDIAKDKDAGFNLLNQINNRAAQLSRVRVSNDALRQNQQDSANRRQGRAATVINS